MIREIENKAKEALKDAKLVPYEPTGRWGGDERNFKELSEKEREKLKEDKAVAEKGKQEYREKVKKEGRARIGLEIIDLYPELIEKRRKSVEPIFEEKPQKQKNKEIQEWIKKKKMCNKEKAMIEEMQKHEANVKRLKVLKELELMSKPPKGPQKVDKKKEIIKKLK